MTAAAKDDAPWTALVAELDAWAKMGRRAKLWWRDDDATSPGPRLDRLISLAPEVPVALAVIPEETGTALANRLASEAAVIVLQHGFAHVNHAEPTAKKSEYGPDRPVDVMTAEIGRGRERLGSLFDAQLSPVFVPPWNRIDADLAARLGEIDIAAVSTFGSAAGDERPPRLNTHVDLIDWRGARDFVGAAAAIVGLVSHVAAGRDGGAHAEEATGLLTHHRDHDPNTWNFLERLFEATKMHRAAEWLDIGALLESHR